VAGILFSVGRKEKERDEILFNDDASHQVCMTLAVDE
jgi:hypothetical protein